MAGAKYFSSPLNHQDICPWLLHLRGSLRACRPSWDAVLSEVSVPDILLGNNPLHSLDSCYRGLLRNSVLRPTPNSFAPFLCLATLLKFLVLNLTSLGHLAPILRLMGLIAQTQKHMSARLLSSSPFYLRLSKPDLGGNTISECLAECANVFSLS